MQERDLAAIGAEVEMPGAAAYNSRRAHRELRAGQSPAVDRLSELADWWGRVAGNPQPRRADQLWLSRPPIGPQANAQLVIRPFDAPKSVSEAIEWGVAAADQAVDEATDVLLVSIAPGDRDEVAWQVLAAHLLDIDPLEATGWPTADRTTDQEWVERIAAIRDGLRHVRGIRNQPEQLLELLDSPALAAGTALLLQAASRRTPALLDGPGAAACALLAHRVGRASRSWWQACDAGHRGLHDRVLTELRLTPLTRLGLPVEDGTAALLGLTLLETALGRAIENADGDLDEISELEEPEDLNNLEDLDERPDGETDSTAPDA
ncbi:MAG TPA: nicotinate-nucleotide--dimethylbenzimidazole phosphoribosyltransferase [Kineosporiaceae bacterium]|nr:nicotinate-nucleotide--dimethylbenzimidazole phosphoribosyltransferase [Kineosporiaceae bacterium]